MTTFGCDLCGTDTIVWNEDDMQRFQSEWYSSPTLDLCPDCKAAPRGEARILLDKQKLAKLRGKI